MSRTRKFFNRIVSILVALTLCFGTTLTAFATEETPTENVVVVDANPRHPSTVSLLSADVQFVTDNQNLEVTLSDVKSNVSCGVCFPDAPGGYYTVTVTVPNGTPHSTTVKADGYYYEVIGLQYAFAGNYIFKVTRPGSTTSVRTIAAIYR